MIKATTQISAKLSAKYCTSAEGKIDVISAKAYTEFAAEFATSFSSTITRSISEKTVTAQSYTISNPSEYGFYTVT